MKLTSLVALLMGLILANVALANEQLLTDSKADRVLQTEHNKQRESAFKATQQSLQTVLNKLKKQQLKLQKQSDQLAKSFSENETSLAHLEQQLRLQSGSLGELFAVVRQASKSLQQSQGDSFAYIDKTNSGSLLEQISAAKTLPSLKELQGLWLAYQAEVKSSAEVTAIQMNYLSAQGVSESQLIYRLGSFALLGEQGYLRWLGPQQVSAYAVQPETVATTKQLQALTDGQMQFINIDPSGGILLDQLAQQPSLKDRLDHAGIVGKVIIALLLIGLLISLGRGVQLIWVAKQIQKQLKNPQQITNNPLGKILAIHQQTLGCTVEVLELRLLEAIVDQQQGLEKGLSMLKLLAALAPMLGLLGTVTGMIETFQVITLFGNGDPKVMAGGISMALMTTVLGLVAAMPLLLAHNLLTSQADKIRQILEKQGIGLVATQAEKDLASRSSVVNIDSSLVDNTLVDSPPVAESA
ncbi:MAG: MotA/TolQ/ExbB proton channel family protein [Psychromonas sp.]|nr:MotA/TolQ/ExbB proton channel family protein [Alteromonadales bacterium]MCP5078006.1 MotA/TolQ/ExbB proton channel family protein [Psychromonas sp.]